MSHEIDDEQKRFNAYATVEVTLCVEVDAKDTEFERAALNCKIKAEAFLGTLLAERSGGKGVHVQHKPIARVTKLVGTWEQGEGDA